MGIRVSDGHDRGRPENCQNRCGERSRTHFQTSVMLIVTLSLERPSVVLTTTGSAAPGVFGATTWISVSLTGARLALFTSWPPINTYWMAEGYSAWPSIVKMAPGLTVCELTASTVGLLSWKVSPKGVGTTDSR